MKNIILIFAALAIFLSSCKTNDAERVQNWGYGKIERVYYDLKDSKYYAAVALPCKTLTGLLPYQYDLAGYGFLKNPKALNTGDTVLVYRNDWDGTLFLSSQELSKERLAELTKRDDDENTYFTLALIFATGLLVCFVGWFKPWK